MNRMRQVAPETVPNAHSHREQARPHRGTLQRLGLACLGVLGLAALFTLAGCPANLSNPQDYNIDNPLAPGGAGAGMGSGGAAPWANVPTTCMEAIFTTSCATAFCHQAGGQLPPAAGLDLGSPNVAARLVDQPAAHEMAVPNTGCMPGKLIDSTTPAASWLLLKLNTPAAQQMCGVPMPSGSMLPADQIACIQTYINAVAAATNGGT